MRTLLSSLLFPLLAFSFVAHADGEFVPVCRRVAAMRLSLERVFQKKCSNITQGEIASLKTLDVHESDRFDTTSLTLRWNDLQGMTSMRELHISAGKMNMLPNGLFESMPNLEILSLPSITDVLEGTFTGLRKLRKLSINSDVNYTIHENALRVLPNLRVLHIVGLANAYCRFLS